MPVVGTAVVAFQPTIAQLLSGVTLQLTPRLEEDSAVVEVLSVVSGWGKPGPSISLTSGGKGAVATTQPSGDQTSTDIISHATASLDRLNVTAQQLATTVRIPLGKPILVGGMTFDPDRPETTQPQGKPGVPDAPAADGKQLYLVLTLTPKM